MEKYIKKSLVLVSVFTFFLFNFGGIVLAQTIASPDIAPIPPNPDTSNSLLFGQKHSYSVVFRGNGEAITYAKLVIPNKEEQALSEFSFEIPKVNPSEMIMYQMKLPKECVRYNYTDPNNPCVEYRDPDYGQDYYYYGSGQTAEYTKIKYTQSGNTYNLTLPNSVEPSKSTAIIISYAAKGYVDNSFGLYKFNFETIKVNSRIQSMRVAVDVDSDLVLKGKQSSVNYNEGVESMPMAKLGDSSAVSSRELDRVVSNIGVSGALIKESKSLAPNESFNVRGEYAKNWFRLYLNEIIIAVLVIIVIIILIYLISKYISSKPKKGTDETTKLQDKTNNIVNKNSINLFNLTNVLVSLGSIFSTVIITYLLLFLFLGISLGINNEFVGGAILIVAIMASYGFTLVAPAIMIVLKKGWGSLLSIIILQFIWFVIILALYLLLFQSGLTDIIPMPRPLY